MLQTCNSVLNYKLRPTCPATAADAFGSCFKPMTSEKAYWVSRERKSNPVDVQVAENVIHELEEHLSHLSPTVSPLLSKRDTICWTRQHLPDTER